MGSLKCVDVRGECDNTLLNETNNAPEGKTMNVAQNLNTYEFNGTRNLSADQFWALIDRDLRNALLDFEDKCKQRDDEELVATLRHWQGQEGRRAAQYAAIVKAEIIDRLHRAA